MATITPTFQIKANSSYNSTTAGPFSPSLLGSISKSLTISDATHFRMDSVPLNSANLNWDNLAAPNAAFNHSKLIDGSQNPTPGADAVATNASLTGCWVYIVNTTASGNELIHIGYTDDSDASGGGQQFTELATNNQNKRLFSLKAGEFAFFPFDFTGDLYCAATAANQSMEFWRFDR
jgi:hypothetical protein